MNPKRIIGLIIIVFGIAVQQGYSQHFTPISGIINEYTPVKSIFLGGESESDTLFVSHTTGFAAGDTVMLYAVRGSKVSYGPPSPYEPGEDRQSPWNTGRYLLARIDMILSGNRVVLNTKINITATFRGFRENRAGEIIQLIKVRSYRNAEVLPAGLTAKPWSAQDSTGGVLALMVSGKLRMNGSIDVSGLGFSGASGSDGADYGGACSSDNVDLYDDPFYTDAEVYSGYKGKSITENDEPGIRGWAASINGGGGGNGKFSGGGGGSNWSAGIGGGDESTDGCPISTPDIYGRGGFGLGSGGGGGVYYTNEDVWSSIRIFMGGGGGTGVKMPGYTTTDGGNGGGIVFIMADTVMGNNLNISADGEDVPGTATGAAGGGGAGGCILLEVNQYETALNCFAIGGDGGNTSGTPANGYGGAGGGGLYWVSGPLNSHPDLNPDIGNGTNGRNVDTGITSNLTPKYSDTLYQFFAPLKGFLFNPVPSQFTVCSDTDLGVIEASKPRGGSGSYDYQWVDSSSTQNYWQDIVGATSKDYDIGILSDTTYYRRIVIDQDGKLSPDTSFRIAVYVHQAIDHNLITSPDTVCSGNAPEMFQPYQVVHGGDWISGGHPDSTYNYSWQHREEGNSTWMNTTANTKDSTYTVPDNPGLSISTDYRRIALSGACSDTSDYVHVRVLEPISGNLISSKDTICIYGTPDGLNTANGESLGDGEPGDYRFKWEQRLHDQSAWTTVEGTSNLEAYQPPALDDTTWYRRLVFSGNDDACIDTTAGLEILVLPDIENNLLLSADQQLCQMSTAEALEASTTGSDPALGGGNRTSYVYTWLSSADSLNWLPASGMQSGPNDVASNFEPGIMNNTTIWYRRLVESGGTGLVCQDTSISVLKITVLDSITDNRISTTDSRYCQFESPLSLDGEVTGGENRNKVYSWYRYDDENIPAEGELGTLIVTGGEAIQNLDNPEELLLDTDRWYRRVVNTGPMGECLDTSGLVHLLVHTAISDNGLDTEQAICIADQRRLRGHEPEGGELDLDTSYTWRRWNEGESQAQAVDQPNSDAQQFLAGPFDGIQERYYFDRIVEIGECRDTSDNMRLTVMQLPGGSLLPHPDFESCSGYEEGLGVSLLLGSAINGHAVAPADTAWTLYLNMERADKPDQSRGPFILEEGNIANPEDSIRGVLVDTEDLIYEPQTFSIDSIYFLAEDNYRCYADVAGFGDPVIIDVYETPEPGIASDSSEVCRDFIILDIDTDEGEASWQFSTAGIQATAVVLNESYRVEVTDNLAYTGLYQAPDDYEAPDTIILYSTAQTSGCVGKTTLPFRFFEQPEPARAREDDTLFVIDEILMDAEPATAGYGEWTLDEGEGTILEPYLPNTLVVGIGKGANTFSWTVRNGLGDGLCMSSDVVSVLIREDARRYEGISPNDDGVNDYFIMGGLGHAETFTIRFFNDKGKPVQIVTDENVIELSEAERIALELDRDDGLVVWDGTASNGNKVPSGTYYYVLEYTYGNDKPIVKKDFLVVISD